MSSKLMAYSCFDAPLLVLSWSWKVTGVFSAIDDIWRKQPDTLIRVSERQISIVVRSVYHMWEGAAWTWARLAPTRLCKAGWNWRTGGRSYPKQANGCWASRSLRWPQTLILNGVPLRSGSGADVFSAEPTNILIHAWELFLPADWFLVVEVASDVL
jgi:hypothetical protein